MTLKNDSDDETSRPLYLYRIFQNENSGYDTYDSAVVCAYSEEDARTIHPCGNSARTWGNGDWAAPREVNVKYLGEAHKSLKRGAIVASFNAG